MQTFQIDDFLDYILTLDKSRKILDMGNNTCCEEMKQVEESRQDFNLMKCHTELCQHLDSMVFKKQHWLAKCEGGSIVTHVCQSFTCKNKSFICSNADCHSCSKGHTACRKQSVGGVETSIKKTFEVEKTFLIQMQEQDRSFFRQLQQSRNIFIKQSVVPRINAKMIELQQLLTNSQKTTDKQIREAVRDLSIKTNQVEEINNTIMKDYKKELITLRRTFQSIQKQYLTIFGNKMLQFQLPNNPHNSVFGIEKVSVREAVITMEKSDKNWYNFVKNVAIPKNAISSFKIKQIQTHQLSFLAGVATSSVWDQKNSTTNKEALMYVAGDGAVCDKGRQRQGGRKIKEGETLTVTVDLQRWKVKWSIDSQVLSEADLSSDMRSKQLYLTVMMIDKGDKIAITSE